MQLDALRPAVAARGAGEGPLPDLLIFKAHQPIHHAIFHNDSLTKLGALGCYQGGNSRGLWG